MKGELNPVPASRLSREYFNRRSLGRVLSHRASGKKSLESRPHVRCFDHFRVVQESPCQDSSCNDEHEDDELFMPTRRNMIEYHQE